MNFKFNTARTAGIFYLLIIVSGIFAEFFVRSSLIVPGEISLSVEHIIRSESLFRISIVGDVIMIISDIIVALLFYNLFKPVNKLFSLLAALFRFVQATILSVNLLNLFAVLSIIKQGSIPPVFEIQQLNELAGILLNLFENGYSLGLLFFGINCAIIGFLIIKSEFLPRVLGIMLLIASLGYLSDSFAKILMTNYNAYKAVFELVVFIPAVIAELSLCLWLIIKGVKEQPLVAATN